MEIMSENGIRPETLTGLARLQESGATYLPEPSLQVGGLFRDALKVAANSVSGGGVVGSLSEVINGSSFEELIDKQIQVQLELQATSMVSNVERAKHESRMAAIRNVRIG